MEDGRFLRVEQEGNHDNSNNDGGEWKCEKYILDEQSLELSKSLDLGIEKEKGTEDDS